MIDRRFIDVDFPAADSNLCGALLIDEQRLPCGASGEFETKIKLLPRNEWDERIEGQAAADLLDPYIRDQGREGACVGNGTAAMFDRMQMLQSGSIVRTSAMSLYRRIGRTASSGAYLGDALEEMRTRGILPVDSEENRQRFKHVHPATGFSRKLPDGDKWQETAKLFRIVEYWSINSFEGLVTAILDDGLGVVYARDQHCICGWRIVKDNGTYYVKYKNSWGNWGDGGYGYDSERKLRGTQYGWFAARTITARI
jgi:hypothetical protein